ncbi:GNAT family N-acetyltransferase [Rhodovulum euryhalinum]|uniref:GNAT family acetyltransferase n=1 Tax=Rhodovulum euryhalinum TaxID=35805 RepID=A0A4R2KBW3_9RHOB|nr:GNAT family N-acetyltransferase [Rhodovulum euryhalinum]TCO70334.1 GNAT family acetyltransferase [Rhodovulum euryhalinum]
MGRSRLPHPRGRDLSGLRLRAARPGDGPAAHAVLYAAVHGGTAAAYGPEERAAWAPSPDPAPDWEARLLDCTTILAEMRWGIVGFMALAGDGHLDLAYVAPDWIGRGVGGALHDAILDVARGAGLGLLATEASLIAQPFFTRHGWRQTARQSVIRNGVPLTNFRMELDLQAALARP